MIIRRILPASLACALCLVAADARKPSASLSRAGHSAADENNTGGISAPVLGLVTNSGRTSVQPMLGVPVASALGSPIDLAAIASRLFPSPGQKWMLGESANGGGLVAIPMDGAAPGEPVSFALGFSSLDHVAFSPSGQFALVYHRADAHLLAIHASGRVIREWRSLPITVEALAINDSGASALAASTDGSLYDLSQESGGAPMLIHKSVSPPAITFLPDSTLVVADPGAGTLISIEWSGRAPSIRIIADKLPPEPMLLAPSPKGRKAFGILPNSSKAFRADLADGGLDWIDLPCRASMLMRLRNGDSFAVSAEEGESVWWISDSNGSLEALFSAATRSQE